jgi:hypothetical protein
MGVFGSVNQVSVLPVLDAGQECTFGGTIARQLIRDDHARNVQKAFEQLPKELLGRCFPAPSLREHIEHIPLLVHRAPQIIACSMNREEHFVEMLCVARLGGDGATGAHTAVQISDLIGGWRHRS